MSEFKHAEVIIESLVELVEIIREGNVSSQIIEDIEYSKKELNFFFYHSHNLKFQKFYNVEVTKELSEYVEELEYMIQIWHKSIDNRRANSVDAEFAKTYEFFKYVDTDTICQMVVNHFLRLPEQVRDAYTVLRDAYQFLEYSINYKTNDFSLIKHLTDLMSEKIEDYKWLYEHLEDYRSKAVLNGIIRFWFDFNFAKLHSLNETVFYEYFDLDLLDCDENTTMVDLGAFTGNTTKEYIDTYKKYKKIYAYEITPSSYQLLKDNVADCQNVIAVNKGAADFCGKMYVDSESSYAGNKLVQEGTVPVEVVTLDEDISEPIGVLKMDIEGAEKAALLGAVHHITNEKPALLISTYHVAADIFDIPKMIKEMRNDYKLYMRYYGWENVWPCDYVLFAI